MAESRRHAVKGSRWWAAGAISGGSAVVLAVLGLAALTVYVARAVVTPPKRRAEDTAVISFDPIAMTAVFESTPDAKVPGDYSFWFSGATGHAKVGEIVASDSRSVTRRILEIDGARLEDARHGRFSGWLYRSPAELGLPYDDVDITTELGTAPAWLIPAASPSGRWVISVHGRAVLRAEALRSIPVFHECGYTNLIVSYRNDGEAPRSADGRYSLGDVEWRDVDAALRYAIDHGATDVILMGWSMGGATVLQELTRSAHAGIIRGLILESPVVDWITALRYQGQILRLPIPVRSGVISVIGGRWAKGLTGQDETIDLRRLDFVSRSAELAVPILILHSDDDGFIPPTASRALAEKRPDIVTYEAFTVARHTKLWNYDRERWNSAIRGWLHGNGFVG